MDTMYCVNSDQYARLCENKMKKLSFILGLIIIVLIGGIYVLVTELRDVNRVQQSTIDGLKRRNEANEKKHLRVVDSISIIQAIQADSTRYYRLLKTKDQQSVNTKTESHEKIVFVNLNDSARHSKLAKFYPSYVRP